MTTICTDDAVSLMSAAGCSDEEIALGSAYAELIGYSDEEGFFSLAMSRILYSDAQLDEGARFAVEPGSLDVA